MGLARAPFAREPFGPTQPSPRPSAPTLSQVLPAPRPKPSPRCSTMRTAGGTARTATAIRSGTTTARRAR
eukprot:3894914-Prymnesium_polylepis.1